MKKITSTLLSFVMIFCMMLTGCQLKKNNKNSEVSLISISASAYEEKNVKAAKLMICEESVYEGKNVEAVKLMTYEETNLGESEIDSENKDNETILEESETEQPESGEESSTEESTGEESKEEEKDEPIFSEETTYTFIFKSQLDINFDIKLNNPKNYYIMDFKLTCDEEDIQYYDEKMEKWTSINDIWIRWSGSNNQESRYRLRLPNPEVSPDKIKISEMYYSDRTDGTNKTAVNMNNKETYTIYKVEDNLVVTETVSNSCEKYVFRMTKKEGVEIKSFTVAGVDYMDRLNDEGLYEMTSNGKIVVEYEKKDGDVTYKGKYEKDVELVNIVIDETTSKWAVESVNGTDIYDLYKVIIEYNYKESYYYDKDYELKTNRQILNVSKENLQTVNIFFADTVELDGDGNVISFTGGRVIKTFDFTKE